MLISYRWLCNYLPTPAPSVERVEEVLIHAGFPIEQRTSLDGGDWLLDVEITSNRGDCLSHIGLAREVAAKLGAGLILPELALPAAAGASAGFALENRVPDLCPRFSARVIRGVKVGPSPAWLVKALEAVGQRSINNVVDVTNFVCAELGNPSHVFDLRKLAGGGLIVRAATPGEKLTTLDGKGRTLAAGDVVVADVERAQSLAGVIGGQDSEVDASTTDVVLEVATWDPVAVRLVARRHQVRTDASHRFERVVGAGTIAGASARAASLILELAGGRLDGDVVVAGAPERASAGVSLRPERCRGVLGMELTEQEIPELLGRLGVTCRPNGRGGAGWVCEVPAFRPDLTREIDLIEEIGRLKGLEQVPLRGAIPIVARAGQRTELARRELGATLCGLGYFEAVTFSFTSRKAADMLLPAGMTRAEVDDSRRGDEPVLRPSVLSGLLACRQKNQYAMASQPGGVRLFEVSSVFAQQDGASMERTNLGLLADVPTKGRTATMDELRHGVRLMRGAIEALMRVLAGPGAKAEWEARAPHAPGLDPRAYAGITLNGRLLGYMGLVAAECQRMHDLTAPVVGAELWLEGLIADYPPKVAIRELPEFPGSERDISLIVAEQVRWADVERAVLEGAAPPLEGVSFVTTFRGEQIGKGQKSVTLRLAFRDASRTLKREEADGAAAAILERLKARFGATVRT